MIDRRRFILGTAAAGINFPVAAFAQTAAFEAWVAKFRARATARGVSDATYARVMTGLKPETDLIIESECLKIAHEVAFTRGYAFQTTRDDAVAIATATFMLTPLDALPQMEKR